MKDVRKHVSLAAVWEASIWLIHFPQRGAALLRLAINPGSACPSSFRKNLCYNMLQSLTSHPRCFHLRADRIVPQREPGNFHSNVVSSLHVKLTTWFVTLASKLKNLQTLTPTVESKALFLSEPLRAGHTDLDRKKSKPVYEHTSCFLKEMYSYEHTWEKSCWARTR